MTVTASASVDRYRTAGWWTRVRIHPGGPVSIVFFSLLIGCFVAGAIFGNHFAFITRGNLSLLLRAVPGFGIVSLGVGLLMIAGEFDLSVGAVYVVTPFAVAFAYFQGIPLVIALLIGFAVAVGIGLANGYITLKFGIPSFITTLGMLFIVRTSAPFIVGYERSVSFRPPEWFQTLLVGNIGPVPMQFIWFLGLAGIAYLILNRHFLGNHFFAAGGNPHAAQYSGINVFGTKMVAFVLSSVFATVSGILSITRLNTAMTNPQLFIELYAVAICVIGGVSLFGGRGSVIGIVIGAAVLQLVQDIILMARLPGFYLDMFVGILIVAGVIANQIVRRSY